MKTVFRIPLLTVLFITGFHTGIADDRQSETLTLETIYGESKISAKSFSGQWTHDGSSHSSYTLLLDAESDNDSETVSAKNIVVVDARTQNQEILLGAKNLMPPGTQKPLSVDAFEVSADRSQVLIYTNTKRVWRRNTRGDYWVKNLESGELTKLGQKFPESSLMFAKFSPDGQSVAYVHDGNIFIESLDSNEIVQVTKKLSPYIINGTSDWVNEEELGIRDGFRFSPDGAMVAFWQFDTSDVPIMTMIDNTAAKYPTLITFPYPKAGEKNSACRIGVATLKTGDIQWANLQGDPRQHYVARIDWAPLPEDAPPQLVIQQLNRLQNTNRVLAWTPESNQLREVLAETDEAWVDVHDEMLWLTDARRFTWASEKDGWRRISMVDYATGKQATITPAGIDAIELVAVNEDQQIAYVIASPDNATQKYLYKVGFDGSGWKRFSPADQAGTHSYKACENGTLAIHTFSNLVTPPVVSLISLPDHQVIHQLESNKALAEFVSQNCSASVSFSTVEIEEGVKLDSWTIEPAVLEPNTKYPLLVYVYGEPAGTTVNDRWSGSTYLWYQMLAQQGYVVKSFDNRGTPAPKGRSWRKDVYRNVGIHAPKDQAAAVRRVLADHSYIDADRVGIWGWSGGGSMTLNAMFKYPDLYSTGISVAPVPNQLGYDTIYQERYMGLPSDNADGYRNGSAIHICDQLKGKLLLVHGTGDDNCHYSTMEQLIDKLIENNKPFDMMSYPNRTHAIREGKDTTLHLRSLMTDYLRKNLPAGPR